MYVVAVVRVGSVALVVQKRLTVVVVVVVVMMMRLTAAVDMTF